MSRRNGCANMTDGEAAELVLDVRAGRAAGAPDCRLWN